MTPRLTKSFAVASIAMLLGTVSATSLVTSAGAQPSGGSHVERRHKPPHHRHKAPHHRHKSRIPQHNGGDHDADNNGGPSDGDGNI